jgi:PIN domain nuclease of toxin-antitoxin system
MHYSPLNIWEIVTKYQKGKLDLAGRKPDDFLDMIEMGEDFRYLELLPGSVATSYQLPRRHKDPFDHLLAWESLQHDLVLLSDDESLRSYEQDGLRIIS